MNGSWYGQSAHIMSMRLTGDHVGNVRDGLETGQSPPQACARAARDDLLLPVAPWSMLALANSEAVHTSVIVSRSGRRVGEDASALKSPVMT
jgi:hypothetical protein